MGATLAAVVPPDDYWPAIAEVCRRHGVLLIADEVMTGFGRTGRWFAIDHWGVRPDILVAAKGASSGYWPFGFVAASDAVYETVTGGAGFVHGFTYSHAPVGAAVAREVLRILEAESLVEASAAKGERLRALATDAFGAHPAVGEIRGRGLMVGIELVADRASREPFPARRAITEAVVRAARDRGVLVYSATGNANGVDGDLILLGPPFVVTDAELERIVAVLAESIEAAAVADAAVALTRSRLTPPRRMQEGPEREQHDRDDQPAQRRVGDVDRAESASRPPNHSCQPIAAARGRAHRGDEQERDPEAERAQAVRLDARRVEQAGHGEGGDDRAGVERPGPAIDRPLDRKASPTASTTTEPSALNSGKSCWIRSSPPNTSRKMPIHGRPGPPRVVGAPLPGVDTDRRARPGCVRRCRGRVASPVPADRPSRTLLSLVSAVAASLGRGLRCRRRPGARGRRPARSARSGRWPGPRMDTGR